MRYFIFDNVLLESESICTKDYEEWVELTEFPVLSYASQTQGLIGGTGMLKLELSDPTFSKFISVTPSLSNNGPLSGYDLITDKHTFSDCFVVIYQCPTITLFYSSHSLIDNSEILSKRIRKERLLDILADL